MMSEELAGQVVNTASSMAQKSFEIAAEIARLLKSIYEASQRTKERTEITGEPDIKSGEAKLSDLKKSGNVSMQTNISARDMETITAKAKDFDIPVSFIGKGENAENVTLAFRTNDKAVIDQILQEVMKEKLAVKPNDYLTFKMENLGEAQTMAEMLKKSDIPADIVKNADGKYMCVYEAKNTEAVNIIKNDFRKIHNEIVNNFSVEQKKSGFVFTDKELDKNITLKDVPTKDQLIKILKDPKHFGYSEEKATEAAHKLESVLSGEKLQYFRTDTRQAALLNNFERNMQLKDDSILVKPYSFARANFSSDNENRYIVSNGEKAAAFIPDKMSRSEMEDAVRYKLGISDPETVKAIVDKTEKISVMHKIEAIKKEAEINRRNGDIGIERRSEKFFEVSQGAVRKSYDFSDKKDAIKALQRDFGISEQKAETVYQKAKNQSPLQNDFHKMAEASRAAAKNKPVKEKKTSKGARA